MQTKRISWNYAGQMTKELARKIKPDYEPSVIIGIMNGGGLVAGLLGQYLDTKGVVCIPVKYYRSISTEPETPTPGQVVAANPDVRDRRILIVDDIMDSGKTMQFAVGLFEKDADEVRTAVLNWRSNRSCIVPDYYAEEVNPYTKYVLYPWEVKPLKSLAGNSSI